VRFPGLITRPECPCCQAQVEFIEIGGQRVRSHGVAQVESHCIQCYFYHRHGFIRVLWRPLIPDLIMREWLRRHWKP
jgi:hypothetical protein